MKCCRNSLSRRLEVQSMIRLWNNALKKSLFHSRGWLEGWMWSFRSGWRARMCAPVS